jgi:hypothetical protein
MAIAIKKTALYAAAALWCTSPITAYVANSSNHLSGDSFPQDMLGSHACEYQKAGYVRDLFCGQPVGPDGKRYAVTDPRSHSFYLTLHR